MLQNTENQEISQRSEVLIDKLLLGKFNLVEVAKVTGISQQLQGYLSSKSILERH